MLLKKLFRTAWKYKAQFISMVIMVTIGIGVFVGFNMEWYTLEKDTADFMSQTNYADYRIYDEKGFSEENLAAIENIEGVSKATRLLNVNVNVKDNDAKSLALVVLEKYNVSTMYIMSGCDYDEKSDGFWLSDKYAQQNDIKLGDNLTIVYRNIEISGEIVGLIKSSEFMICVSGDNQLMPDFSTYGFVYASPKKIKDVLGGAEFYPQINVISDLEKTQLEQSVNATLDNTTLILSKDEHISYVGAQSEIEEGKTMVSVLPVLFLLIGILTMITTMHRITANEKIQIGTLKALGFKNGRILRHYTAYGLFIGIVGSIIGIALGYGIAAIVVNPNGMEGTYFDMPCWKLYAPWWTWLTLIGVILFLAFISFLSVKKMLKGTAADALRPYVPQKVKPLLAEKTRLWNKIPFGTKWNMRDILRHRTRSLMTLIGIVGCMLLLVGGLGMRDTMTNYLDIVDKNSLNYQTRINLTEASSNEQSLELVSKYDGDWLAELSVQLDGEAVSLEIYGITHDFVRFNDENNETKTLSDDGAYICMRLSDKYSVGDMISFSPYGSAQVYSVRVIGFLRTFQTKSIIMTCNYAQSVGIPYRISAVFTNSASDSIESDSVVAGTQSKTAIMDSYDKFMQIMNTMVLVFVVAAVVLGIVVLYNLGVMSYVERYRELATLKVVGFNNRHIGRILISQNLWLTVVGIIIGLPSGIGVLYLLIKLLADEYELKMHMGALTYCVSILLTLGVSLIVGFFVALKNRKINMVEALKGAD